MICENFDPITHSCAPSCAVCGYLGFNCMGKKEAAPVLEHRDGQAKQKVSETDCFASMITE